MSQAATIISTTAARAALDLSQSGELPVRAGTAQSVPGAAAPDDDRLLPAAPITITGWCGRMARPKAGLLAQRVFNAYSKAFNNSNDRSGTLFEDRYSAIAVTSDEYLRHLCRYIHANPVRHGIATAVRVMAVLELPGMDRAAAGTIWSTGPLSRHIFRRRGSIRRMWRRM